MQGFAQTVNAIIDNLPEERQTLLFSATQTKSVRCPSPYLRMIALLTQACAM